MNREDFKILSSNIIYLDNAATTLKPYSVLEEINDYYNLYTSNAHRGDYKNSTIVNEKYEKAREVVANFIKVKPNEIVFTSGTTSSINMITNSFMKYNLKKDDEVLLTKSEHASNILPWFRLAKEIGIKIKFIDLQSDYTLSIENVKKNISDKTKVISIAHITNTIGDIRPIKDIGKICKDNNIYFVVDGAQSVPHLSIDVNENNIDFLVFSAHKMLGPTGVGVLYAKYSLLEKFFEYELGGGMNVSFNSNFDYVLKNVPTKFEAGTQNIEGILAFSKAIEYLEKIGLDKIQQYEMNLKKYAIEKLNEVEDIEIYNKNTDTGIILFNIKNIFPQDLSIFLDKYNICIRAGNHCAKLLGEVLPVKNTCRISLYFYNTKEEIDTLMKVLKKHKNIYNEIL